MKEICQVCKANEGFKIDKIWIQTSGSYKMISLDTLCSNCGAEHDIEIVIDTKDIEVHVREMED